MIAILMALDLMQQIDLFLHYSWPNCKERRGREPQDSAVTKMENTRMVMEVITVTYRDGVVGAVSFDTEKGLGSFKYDPGFIKKARYLKYRAFLFEKSARAAISRKSS